MTLLEDKPDTDTEAKIWANSGDSHFLEPDDLWSANLPKRLADLVPRSEKDPDGEWETVHIDGQSFRRKLPLPEETISRLNSAVCDLLHPKEALMVASIERICCNCSGLHLAHRVELLRCTKSLNLCPVSERCGRA